MVMLVLLVAIIIASIAGVEGANCGIYKASDGSTYDLTALTRDPSIGYSINSGSYTYFFNLCDNFITLQTSTYCYAPAPVYQVSSTNLCYLLGALPPVISDGINGAATGVTIKYTNDEDRCQFGTIPRVVNINIRCDQKTEAVTGITEPSTCMYDIAMTSPAACPKVDKKAASAGLSPGSIFLILLLVLVVVYLVGGVVFRYKFRDIEPGVDLLPNLGFWTSIPGLVKDGCIYSYEKIRRRN